MSCTLLYSRDLENAVACADTGIVVSGGAQLIGHELLRVLLPQGEIL